MRVWLFDFDGTLSPLVADRNAAAIHPACAGMLGELSRSTTDQVAIISSRALEDLLPRIPLKDIIIGGNSGIEWQLPGGCRISLGTNKKDILEARRRELMPLLEKLGRQSGIEIEDKQWSVAIHVEKSGKAATERITKTIDDWAQRQKIALHHGPNVLEVQFLDGFDKSVGATFLASLLKIDTTKDSIFYAGDDENDAVAMRWAIESGGTAIMVGSRLDVPCALYVDDQLALVQTVEKLRSS